MKKSIPNKGTPLNGNGHNGNKAAESGQRRIRPVTVGKQGAGRHIPTGVERTLGKALNAILDFGIAMYEEGKKAGQGKTTTSSRSGVSPVTNIGHGASRKPNARNK